ncbi:MAG: hypothetical protein ACRDK4_13640, partial [Solirubrobacteraceae bacterium]
SPPTHLRADRPSGHQTVPTLTDATTTDHHNRALKPKTPKLEVHVVDLMSGYASPSIPTAPPERDDNGFAEALVVGHTQRALGEHTNRQRATQSVPRQDSNLRPSD